MALNLSAYDPLLKEAYEGVARETLNNEVPAFKMLDEADRAWSGRRVLFPFHTSRNVGVGARAEAGTLPTAGNQGTVQSVVSATYNYCKIQLTGQVMNAGKNVFAEALSFEMENGIKDLVNDLSRQTNGYGDGRLAQVSADSVSSTSISVFNRYAEPGQPGGRFLSQGQIIDGGTVASPAGNFSSATIVSVAISSDPATTTDTVTHSNSALSITASGFLFNLGAGGAGVEMNGFLNLVDDFTQANMWGSNAFGGSAVQGINRATTSRFNSIVLGNSQVARVIDGKLMQTAFDRVQEESGEEPDMIWGHHTTVREFLDSVTSDRRYGSPSFDAGFTSLTYNGVPLLRDRHFAYNTLLVMKKSALKMFTLLDLEWASDDGSILSRVSGQDSYDGYLRIYRNLAFDQNPKLCCVIRDIRTD